MTTPFDHNRVILCHFDSYSALLLFARFGRTLLLPEAAPAGASLASDTHRQEQLAAGPEPYAAAAVGGALAERYGFSPQELVCVPQFEEWLSTEASSGSPATALRVHLFRINTFAPPKSQIEPYEGQWKPVSELRGVVAHELGFARRVFDIIMGG